MLKLETEAQIQSAIDDGNLSESRYLDVKAEVGSTDGSRKETAKDLSSFAIDGGMLLIGVAENKADRTFQLSPIALDGAMERLEQVADARIDPPLFVRVSEIPTSSDPKMGYLVVEVPPSPVAPHMVDGVYFARAERTTRKLTDPEVARLISLRRNQLGEIHAILSDEIARNPVAEDQRKHGHFYVVAEPLSGWAGMAESIARASNNSPAFALRASSEPHLPNDLKQTAPEPTSAFRWARRSRGGAFTTFEGSARQLGSTEMERHSLDIEFEEDGGIRLWCGRMTDEWGQPEQAPVILDVLAVAHLFRVVLWARQIANDVGYRGGWAFAFEADGLKDLQSYRLFSEFGFRSDGATYDRDTYRRSTTAHLAEMEASPGRVVQRLIGGLLRGLGTDTNYELG